MQQYFIILNQQPDNVYRFYTDASRLTRSEGGPQVPDDTVVTQQVHTSPRVRHVSATCPSRVRRECLTHPHEITAQMSPASLDARLRHLTYFDTCGRAWWQKIHEKVMSMDFGGVKFEIKSIDSQDSLNAGVLVVVTGTMWSKASKRDFVQTFFLAPQEKGYYVLNDISRYQEEEPLFDTPQQHTGDSVMSNGVVPPVEQPSEVLFAVGTDGSRFT